MRIVAFPSLALTLGLVACGSSPAPVDSPASTRAGEEAPPEGTYRVVLTRPARMGETYREHTVHRRAFGRRVSVNGAVIEETAEEVEVEILTAARVVEVTASGRATVIEHRIEGCVARDANGERAIVPAGSVVRVTRVPHGSQEGTIELVGGTLTEEDVDLLRTVFSTSYSPRGDDAIFGSDEPRRVGETWPIDTAAAATDLNKIPSLRLREEDLGGATALRAVETIDGVPCLIVEAEIHAQNLQMEPPPEGATVESAQMVARTAGAFPTDPGIGRLRDAEEMLMEIRMRVARPDGSTALVEIRSVETESSEFAR